MKRHNNLFQQLCSIENLKLADALAQMGKSRRPEIISHNKNADANIIQLQRMLVNKTFTTSPYTTFTVYEEKERLVYKLPYYPDIIVHYAILNVIEQIIVDTFTADAYACVKGRGVHKAARAIRNALRDEANTLYSLQIDVKKFYPSVDHTILKQQLRRKFKDNDLLWLLDNIIDSAPGLPIGNLLSQSLSTFYLTGFDHWIKEVKRLKYYFRYVDDIIILASDKTYLHKLRAEIAEYWQHILKLEMKPNWRVSPVNDSIGIDMLGYKFFRKHTLLRKRLKKNFARAVAKRKGPATIASYKGWAKHSNSRHLIKKLLPNEQL